MYYTLEQQPASPPRPCNCRHAGNPLHHLLLTRTTHPQLASRARFATTHDGIATVDTSHLHTHPARFSSPSLPRPLNPPTHRYCRWTQQRVSRMDGDDAKPPPYQTSPRPIRNSCPVRHAVLARNDTHATLVALQGGCAAASSSPARPPPFTTKLNPLSHPLFSTTSTILHPPFLSSQPQISYPPSPESHNRPTLPTPFSQPTHQPPGPCHNITNARSLPCCAPPDRLATSGQTTTTVCLSDTCTRESNLSTAPGRDIKFDSTYIAINPRITGTCERK